ncbi:MAG TPA: hypothetical protein VKT70_04355, partial [Stellaceae bacterium]|nr:hypothetical protein [Stellaceae bacterium]
MKSIHSRAYRGRTTLLATVSVLTMLTGGNHARAGGMTITTPQPDGVTTVPGQTYLTITGATAIVTGNVTNPIGVNLAPGVASNPFGYFNRVQSLYLNKATVTGAVVNAGTIQAVNASPTNAANNAEGVHIEGSIITQGLTNSGTVIGNLLSNTGVGNYATGVLIETTQFSGGIRNSGEIIGTVNSTSMDRNSQANGLSARISGPQNVASVFNATNTGIIIATATATATQPHIDSFGEDFSLFGSRFTGVIDNRGTVTATTMAVAGTLPNAISNFSAIGAELFLGSGGAFTGTVDNSGVILASGTIPLSITAASGTHTSTTKVFGSYAYIAGGFDTRSSSTFTGAITNAGSIGASLLSTNS